MQIRFSDTKPSDVTLVAHIVDKGKFPSDIEPAMVNAAKAARFTGKPGQLVDGFFEHDGMMSHVALAGAGEPSDKNRTANLERAGAAISAKYLVSGISELAIDLSGSRLDAIGAAAVLTGFALRSWRYDIYRTRLKPEQKVSLESAVVIGAPDGTDAAWQDAAAVVEGVEFTRELVSEPANIIFPVSFVERCQERFAGTGAEITVLDEEQMAKLGMGALLGVGLGSEQPSRLLAIRWNGGGDEPLTAFVGKGVTFDTGGISLKPGPGMGDMKWDMGGAGAVAGAMLALVKRKAKANIVGVCGLVENMPDGRAQRPGDIVTSMSGQTIEVLNTDAEGRLVLCDALHWTQQEYSPARIVDFATLTGAMIIALGHEHGGLFSNDDKLANALLAAGSESGDKLWRLPVSAAYDKLIDSPIADMKNIGPREAGSITAAQFLKRYIGEGVPWAHCDIAGMVWADKPGPLWDKGATGYGVRLMDRFVRDNAEG